VINTQSSDQNAAYPELRITLVITRRCIFSVDYLLFCSIHSSERDERQGVGNQRQWTGNVRCDSVADQRDFPEHQLVIAEGWTPRPTIRHSCHRRLTRAAPATHNRYAIDFHYPTS